ncbi:MAG: rRNA maturation RNase YbeY [Burkholderiales bacterium]
MSATRTRQAGRPASSIAVQVAVVAAAVPARARLRRWALAALRGRAEVTLRIVGTAEARRLNRVFRGRDYATDVLTFVYCASPRRGDIVLCHPVLARAARERRIALEAHYAHLVVHGMLHLRGYDHERHGDARRMEGAEAKLLARLGYADPYAVESARSTR